MNFFEHLDKEFAQSKDAFLYSINRLPESKIIVVNVGLNCLMYDSGLVNIRSLKNFIADISELLNSDSKKRVVIVISDSVENTSPQYFSSKLVKKANDEGISIDSRLYSALVSVIHSDIVNLFYEGFADYNFRTIGFSVSSNGADLAGEFKHILKSIESIASKPQDKLSSDAKISAIKNLIHSSKNITQATGFNAVIQKTSETIKGLFKAYPRTIPIIMEDISQKVFSADDDGLAAKISIALSADVLVSISRKGMLYTIDPVTSSSAQPFYCYDTSRKVPFTPSRRGDLSKKLNAACSVNSHSRPIPMVLTSYISPFTICKIFSADKVADICEKGEFPFFTTFIDTKKIVRFSSDKSLPIEHRLTTGKIVLNENAVDALVNKKSSLLSVGIVSVEGDFDTKMTVAIFNENNEEIGKGVTDVNSDDLKAKMQSGESVTVINRTRMVLSKKAK